MCKGRFLSPSLTKFKLPEGGSQLPSPAMGVDRAGVQMLAEYCGMEKGGVRVPFYVNDHFMRQWI